MQCAQYGDALLDEAKSSAASSPEYSAALRALSSAVGDTDGDAIDAVLPALRSWLDRTAHDALSDAQVAAFRAPEGVLSSEMKTETERVPDIDNSALRKTKKEDSADDTIPAPSLKVQRAIPLT